MKSLFICVAFFCLSSCRNSDTEYLNLKAENLALKDKVETLSKEINDLKFGAKNLFSEAKSKIGSKDFIAAKDLLTNITTNYLSSPEFNSAKSQLKIITPKAEEQLFINGQKNKDVDLLKNYLTEYPKGKYYSKVTSLLKKYQKSQNPNFYSPTTVEQTNSYISEKSTAKKTKKSDPPSSSGMRVGAICCDGTQSSATGRGACSHHGGVCQWIYQ